MPKNSFTQRTWNFLNHTWQEGHTSRNKQRAPGPAISLRARNIRLFAGGLAGLCGGIAMALFEMGASYLSGQHALIPFLFFDDIFRGFFSHTYGTGFALAVGFGFHLVTAAIFGVIFSLFMAIYADENSIGDAFFGGLAYAMLIWSFMTYGFLIRWSNTLMGDHPVMEPEVWFYAHLVFGGALCTTPFMARAIRALKGKQERAEEKPRMAA